MFESSINIDVEIHQEEVQKPSHSSVVLVPLKNNSTTIHQLVLKMGELENKGTPKMIDDVSQVVFREWQSIFSLYPVQRAFANVLDANNIEVYITFDANNIFSNTQIRNIKRTISELFESTWRAQIEASEKEIEVARSVPRGSYGKATSEFSDPSKRRAELDLRERFNYLQEENKELQSALQQSKVDELSQKENIDELRLEIQKQQRSLEGVANTRSFSNPDTDAGYQKIQNSLEETNYKLRQAQQELLDKQREIQRLQSVSVENERYINALQADYDQLRESSDFQLEKILDENDQLKAELTEYQTNELDSQQEVQLIKSEMRQIILDTENIQEELKQKVQRMQFENEELRTVIKENQQFEERTHQDLLEATRDLTDSKELIKRLETENGLLTQEWEMRFQTVAAEKEELAVAYKTSRELEMARNTELIELKNHLITLEQQLQQSELDKKQLEANWQTRLMSKEQEKDRLVQQVTLDKDKFLRNKEQEIQRLSDRLAQQKQLVDKLMANQSDTQVAWQENNEALELNYQNALEKSAKLEAEVLSLVEKNKSLELALAAIETAEPLAVAATPVTDSELDIIQQEIDQEVAELSSTPVVEVEEVETEEVVVDDEDTYYDYEEEDTDYEYGYDDEDYDYDYHEVDDLVQYSPESIEEDVEDLLDNKDDEGKEKISKKDFAVYELYVNHLEDLVEQADGEDFKAFVEPKMKKFKKFKKAFEEDVKAPTLFSRKYKLTTGLANEMKAYVLMSRHLSILLDVEVSDDDYEYDYEYDYDYEDYDYEYDYDYDYD